MTIWSGHVRGAKLDRWIKKVLNWCLMGRRKRRPGNHGETKWTKLQK